MTVPYTFGNESSPIPLSQLDANFAAIPNYANTAGNVVNSTQANITAVGTLISLSVAGNVVSGNLLSNGILSAISNVSAGNITTTGLVSAFGTVTGAGFSTSGTISASGNITAGGNISVNSVGISNVLTVTGNVTTSGNIAATGQISAQGNILAQGIVSATGNIVTAENFIGNFLGNVTGNLSVGGSNTQVLFNNNGNVGAAGGLTYNSGSNTLGILGVVSAQGNITAGGNITVTTNATVGGNLQVTGTTQLVGAATAPTAPTGTANNQVATTAFVINNGVPSGCILLWSGSIISIPSGWYLCDGNNSTPDLRDRFIVGAGFTYNVANVGGSANSIVVSHTHSATSTDSGHTHTQNLGSGSSQPGLTTSQSPVGGQSTTATGFAVITTTIASTGSSGTNANLPPYYALAYIMKA